MAPEAQEKPSTVRSQAVWEKRFIIGYGPSFSGMDLSPLKRCPCLGSNKIYLLLVESDFKTDYHVAVKERLYLWNEGKPSHRIDPSPIDIVFRGKTGQSFGPIPVIRPIGA